MKKVIFLITDAGGGHRSAANALKEVIEGKKLPWQVSIVNLYREVVGSRAEDLYNYLVLRRGVTWIYWRLIVPYYRFLIFLVRARGKRNLRQFFAREKPDLVVSLMPFVNREIYDSLKKTLPAVPFAVVICDLMEYADHYWIEPENKDQYLFCPSEIMAARALKLGFNKDKLILISGPPINPKFYRPFTFDRREERRKLGLDPDLPTGLVSFGGQGSDVMMAIAGAIDHSRLNVQLIFNCGRNEKLAIKLKSRLAHLPNYVVTYTSEMPYYMHLSDFFVGKPGNLSIAEAIHMKLPVITEDNFGTMLQEKYVPILIREKGLGVTVGDFLEIRDAVARVIEPENLKRLRANLESIKNDGVFEAVETLEKIMPRAGE